MKAKVIFTYETYEEMKVDEEAMEQAGIALEELIDLADSIDVEFDHE